MGKTSVTSTPTQVEYNNTPGESSRLRAEDERDETSSRRGLTRTLSRISTTPTNYRVYKRRFFGLIQLILLNIVVSWNWINFAPISTTAADYFNTSETNINWLSTVIFFAFVSATPFTIYTLAKHGPKSCIVVASCLLLMGNWIKYGGTKAKNFPVVMFSQLLVGFAQPFVLTAPTTYSNIWFSPQGRTSATAVASLANAFGAALGQLISPFWATTASEVPNCVLYTALIASAACIPAFFIPSKPPTPPAASIPNQTPPDIKSLLHDLRILSRSPEFYMLFIPFSVLVGFFNAFSSLLNQILAPYSFTEDEAGIAGALLIFVGLVSAAISSPLIDRYKFHLWYIRVSVPIISIMYLVFYFAPPTRQLVYVYIVCAILGAASFGLVPVVLEFLVELHYPLGPETGSTVFWCGGQLSGAISLIIMDKLKGDGHGGNSGDPPGNMSRALIFQAVLAMVVMPLPLMLGQFGRKDQVRMRRWEAEKRGAVEDTEVDEEEPGAIRHGGESS